MTEHHITITDLKANLSGHLAKVREGDEIIITQRGAPVARLSPFHGDAAREARTAGLVRTGLARGPRTPLDASFLDGPRPSAPSGWAMGSVLADRAQGW